MKGGKVILQIVPRAPGGRDGVGDYARTLALHLQRIASHETTFVSATRETIDRTAEGFTVLSPLAAIPPGQWQSYAGSPIIMHYVNYGYHRRGVPRALPARLRELRQICRSRFVTIFHELYASGQWWQSAFWLSPLQRRITGAIARLSDVSMVSSEALAGQLGQLYRNTPILVRPVFSNFGEPSLARAQIAGRDPGRWAICGGTALVERSVRSFLSLRRSINERSAPRELFVIGGAEHNATRHALADVPDLVTHYLPAIDVSTASRTLSSCAYGWLDYFAQSAVPTGAILKSTAFAAFCAHGVVPVFPATVSSVGISDDSFPGPFSVTSLGDNLPDNDQRAEAAQKGYAWYVRNAASTGTAERIAVALEL